MQIGIESRNPIELPIGSGCEFASAIGTTNASQTKNANTIVTGSQRKTLMLFENGNRKRSGIPTGSGCMTWKSNPKMTRNSKMIAMPTGKRKMMTTATGKRISTPTRIEN